MSSLLTLPKIDSLIFRSKRIPSRALWCGIDAAATPLATVVLTGGLMRTLGSHDYGLLVVAMAFSNITMGVNGAIATTTTKVVADASGSFEPQAGVIARLVAASVTVVAAAGLFMLLATHLLSMPIARLLLGAQGAATSAELHWVLLLAVLAVSIQQIDGVFAAALKGLERFKLQALIEAASRASLCATVICAAFISHRLVLALAAQCAVLCCSVAARAFALRSVLPAGRLLVMPGRAEMRSVLGYGAWIWLYAIAFVLFGSLDRIVISQTLGPAAAAEFQLYVQLSQLIHFVPNGLFAFCLPLFSRMNAAGAHQRADMRETYIKSLLKIVAISVLVACPIAWFARPLVTAFAGPEFHMSDFSAFGILIVAHLLMSFGLGSYYLLLGVGSSKAVSLISIASGAVMAVTGLLLIPSLGLYGAAIARLAYAGSSVWYFERCRRVFAGVR